MTSENESQIRPASFDNLTRLAAIVCGTPVGLIGLIDGERQRIVSHYRWNVAELPANNPLTTAVINRKECVVVEDASADATFANDPLVVSGPRVRFFAAAPLQNETGEVIGLLIVLDQAPRQLKPHQIEALRSLADQFAVIERLEKEIGLLQTSIDQSKRSSEELAEIEERARDLFENADDLIMSIHPDGALLHVNRATTSSLSYNRNEIARMAIFDLVHPDARVEFTKLFRDVITTGETRKVETVFLTAMGHRRTVDGTLIPKVFDGQAVLVRVIFRDISDRKRIEIELGQARDAALESARVKSQFLTNVTHEVRTPMNVMVGMLDLLLKSEVTEDQKDWAQTALASAESLLATINNIIHVSTLEAGSLSIMVADFDLRSAVERVVEVMRVVAMESALDVTLSFDGEIPAVLRGDVARLRQILSNLVSNAVKFTEKGKVSIRVSWEKESDTHLFFRFEVTDTGPGIPQDRIEQLFQPFSQIDASQTRVHAGMGLGLVTSRQLVELLNGAIGVDSELGQGSTFWFTVPFEKRQAHELAVSARKGALAGSRMIIYDRSETSRKIVQQYLESWGVRTRSEPSSELMLERMRGDAALGDPYRVAIIDLHAADRNGIELTREIKNDSALESTNVILLASLGEALNDQRLREAGVGGYLSKPVEQSELFDLLTAVMSRSVPFDSVKAPRAHVNVSSPDSKPRADPNKVRILLAEDKPLNQKLTRSQLKNLGYSADIANNGQEVIEAVTRGPYDLILMDCQMPIKDGYEATMEIRRREGKNRKIRIVAMTANAREGDRERCLAAGMDDYLSKPIKQHDLASVLARWLPA